MQLDPAQLTALAAVLRTGAFDRAAAELHVTPSAISQRIKALEDRTGTALVHRGTPCTGTPAGLRLARHAEDIGLLEQHLLRDLALPVQDARTRLRIAVNADSLATWFVHALGAVPDLLFDLVIDDQDHSADWLRRGEVSAAVTAEGRAAPGCDRIPLGKQRFIAVASPGFATHWFPDGPTEAALERAPCLTFNAKDDLQHRWMQAVTGRRLSPPAHVVPSSTAFVDVARMGLGWGMIPEPLVRGPLRNGRLVALDAHRVLDVGLDWQVSRALARALRPVTDAVIAAAKDRLLP